MFPNHDTHIFRSIFNIFYGAERVSEFKHIFFIYIYLAYRVSSPGAEWNAGQNGTAEKVFTNKLINQKIIIISK